MRMFIGSMMLLQTITGYCQNDEAEGPTQEVVDYCNMLQKLTSEADDNQTVLLHYLSYLALKKEHVVAQGCKEYFEHIREILDNEGIRYMRVRIGNSYIGEEYFEFYKSFSIHHHKRSTPYGDWYISMKNDSLLSSAEIAIFCHLLQKLTASALSNKDGKLFILYNIAYEAFSQNHVTSPTARHYFDDLREKYAKYIEGYNVGLSGFKYSNVSLFPKPKTTD